MAKISAEEAMQNKAILDLHDSDKIKKDLMLKNIEELTKHHEYLNKRIGETTQEYETRRRLVDSLNGSIAGAQSELSNINRTIEKKHADSLTEINKQRIDLENADKSLQTLVQKNRETEKANQNEAARLLEHRMICDAQVAEMKKALADNQSEWGKRESDILRREAELKADREAFQAEKDALVPEAARITSIKNENIMLLQKIEMDRLDIENLRRAIATEKDRINELVAVSESKNKVQADKFANEEARLRKWAQDLSDQALELKAKTARADKILVREQYQKEVDSAK